MKKIWGSVFIGLFVLIFLIAGIGMIVLGILTQKDRTLKEEYYSEAEGTVVGYDSYKDNDNNVTYASIVEYEVEGYTYHYQRDVYSNIKEDLGSKAIVLYNPSNPQEAFVKSGVQKQWIFLVMGILFSFVPILFIIVGCVAKKREKHIEKSHLKTRVNTLEDFYEEDSSSFF